MTKSTWLHLRIPFSIFLLPVYLFALCVAPEINWNAAVAVFLILHFLLYPASNGYNSYFDKDTDSIGGLRRPPLVTKELYYVSLGLDGLAILWGYSIHWKIALMLFIYGLVSKAYSHPAIRLKKYPFFGWLIAGVFQGAFTFFLVFKSVIPEASHIIWASELPWGAVLATLLLWGSFPMTQVYQHKEDQRRGDLTISRKLGIRGTFVFSSAVFLIANAGYIFYFVHFESVALAWMFEIAMIPLMGYFFWWFARIWKNPDLADYRHSMRLNIISAFSLNLFFMVWLVFQ